jgi:hypothetical protein
MLSGSTNTTTTIQSNGTTAITIDSSQNVGIGTASPNAKVQTSTNGGGGDSAQLLRVTDTNTSNSYGPATLTFGNLNHFASNPTMAIAGTNGISFCVGDGSDLANTRKAMIDSNGNLLVNATTQSGKITAINAGDVVSAKTLSNNAFSNFIGYNLSNTATFVVSGNGTVTKASGTFRIEHPIAEKAVTHDLVHSFIEGPNADLIYRGKVSLVKGKVNVNIDTEARMTNGTFVLLCRNIQCFTTNETDWTAVKGSVIGNILTIEAQDATSTAEISWMVIGERKDKHMYETEWTDDNGRPIIEPLKKQTISDAQSAEIQALKVK